MGAATTGTLRHVPPLDPGEILANRYRIAEPSSPGTTGWILRARDEEVDVDVAIKVIAPNLLQTEEERGAFLKAVKSARKVHHPNVVRIYDEGRSDRYVFYTMPFLEGLSLRKIIDLRLEKQQVFALNEALPLFAQLALAIDNLDKHGAHGALRPANITVLPDVLKITGLAHHRGLPRKPFAALQSAANCLEYLAPEARRDDAQADRRADVYSLAVIFSEMVTGQVYGRDAEAWAKAEEKMPPRLLAVLHRGLAEAVGVRYETATAFFEGLAEATAEVQGSIAVPSLVPPPAEQADAEPAASPATVDFSGSRHAESLRSSKRPALEPRPSRVPSRQDRPISAVHRIERRGGKRATPSFVPLAAAAIVLAGVSAAIYYARQRAAVDELKPVRDDGAPSAKAPEPVPAPVKGVRPAKTPDRPVEPTRPPPEPRDRDRDKGKRAGEPRRPDREPTPGPTPPPPPAAIQPVTPTPPPPPAPAPPATVEPTPVEPKPVEPAPAEPAAIAAAPEGKPRCPPGMVLAEGGTFEFGVGNADPMRSFGELLATSKKIDPYCVDIYEFPNERGKMPTTNVSWSRAKKACERVGKRLCTELEWEHACKGPGDARFPYGNSYDGAYCNVGEGADESRKPGPTGVYPRCRSGFGAVDMAGNVAEWTSSSWGRAVPDKVIKGGAADQGAFMSRCAARTNETADGRQPNLGFRCCADVRR
jgi:formylglycine-generating enzyme required for sulfatase activity